MISLSEDRGEIRRHGGDVEAGMQRTAELEVGDLWGVLKSSLELADVEISRSNPSLWSSFLASYEGGLFRPTNRACESVTKGSATKPNWGFSLSRSFRASRNMN